MMDTTNKEFQKMMSTWRTYSWEGRLDVINFMLEEVRSSTNNEADEIHDRLDEALVALEDIPIYKGVNRI